MNGTNIVAKKRDNTNIALLSEGLSKGDMHAMQRATLKQLRKMAKLTQADLSETMGVGQDTVSRLEKRHDMLLSSISHYVESLGGKLELTAIFPNRSAIFIDCLEDEAASASKKHRPPD
ncbi:MAG: helix-turn-helix transcriptional regulator [Alcaligenaceae bacterium]|nr:helix-turn-helix transcriptional regulator [Alcaligenaceae bacterium]